MLKGIIKYYYQRLYQKWHYDTFKTNMLLAKQLSAVNANKENIQSLDDVAFQVFSQRGEDGVIDYICSKIAIPAKTFIEFGVEDYTESNTRLLLFNNWKGLVLDSSKRNIRFIKNDFIYWKYDITAQQCFITTQNINAVIAAYTGDDTPGLLSIDIDGNDYWVWEAITCINPLVVVCEYNAVFGNVHPVSIPYSENFQRQKAHYSCLYFGTSLPALCYLAEKKGYDFIGTTTAGVNAYFVRKDVSAPFIKYTAQTGYHDAANRDSKDKKGRNNFLQTNQRLNEIKDMMVVDVTTGRKHQVKDLYQL